MIWPIQSQPEHIGMRVRTEKIKDFGDTPNLPIMLSPLESQFFQPSIIHWLGMIGQTFNTCRLGNKRRKSKKYL
jgi:hypothetical protein